MKIEEIQQDRFNKYEHKQFCDNCGHTNSVFCQPDDSPEYYTIVYVKCKMCPEWVKFNLPVN